MVQQVKQAQLMYQAWGAYLVEEYQLAPEDRITEEGEIIRQGETDGNHG